MNMLRMKLKTGGKEIRRNIVLLHRHSAWKHGFHISRGSPWFPTKFRVPRRNSSTDGPLPFVDPISQATLSTNFLFSFFLQFPPPPLHSPAKLKNSYEVERGSGEDETTTNHDLKRASRPICGLMVKTDADCEKIKNSSLDLGWLLRYPSRVTRLRHFFLFFHSR